VLPIAPSTYRAHARRVADPSRLSGRAKRDAELRPKIQRDWDGNFTVYGVRKVWRQLNREGVDVARCTVARLMRQMGLQGIVRGKSVRTTVSDSATPCPRDKVNRNFRAPRPNALWGRPSRAPSVRARWTTTSPMSPPGLASSRSGPCSDRWRTGPSPFVIDAFARRIVGWRVSRSRQAQFVLHALEQAVHERRPAEGTGLVHHSDRGSQYVSIRYTERLAEAGIEPSVGVRHCA
jgi:transposase InsO family protein